MSSYVPCAEPEAHEEEWAEWQEWLTHCDDDPRVRPIVEPIQRSTPMPSNYPPGTSANDPRAPWNAEDDEECRECGAYVAAGEECPDCGTYNPTALEWAEDAALERAEAAREMERDAAYDEPDEPFPGAWA